jgi:tetratricopeptide (TPR) repeat protein
VAFTPLFVVHAGADHSPEGRKSKLRRDIRLLHLDRRERPNHPFVHFNFGMTYSDAGKHRKAVKSLRRSLELAQPHESHLRKVYALLAGSYSELGQMDEARAVCRDGLKLFPKDPELLFRHGILLHGEGRLADEFPDVMFLYPVHLNPQVWEKVHARLSGRRNVELRPPAPYPEFVWLMDRSTLILTDSGGVQEEAPSLGKPVVVMRETTERGKAVEAGVAELVGTSVEAIVGAVARLLSEAEKGARRQPGTNPYGDGRAAERIVAAIVNHFASSR